MSGKISGKRTAMLGICTLLVVSALAAPVMAYNKGTTNSTWLPGNQATPGISANLGVQGDAVIVCGWGEWDGNYGASVTEGVSGAGNEVGATVEVRGTNQPDICTGGAFGPFDSGDPNGNGVPSGTLDGSSAADGIWYVVGQDYIVNGCQATRLSAAAGGVCPYPGLDGAGDLRLGKSMLARVQVVFFDDYNHGADNADANKDGTAGDCNVPNDPNTATDECRIDTDFEVFRNVLQMGVCGAAHARFDGDVGGDVRKDPDWHTKLVAGADSPDAGSGPGTEEWSGELRNETVEAQVFENGPLFYFANCVSSEAPPFDTIKATVIGTYDTLLQGGSSTPGVNDFTCGGGEFTLIPLVCFFPFPGQEMDCDPANFGTEQGSEDGGPTGDASSPDTTVAFPAIVGEIAWSVDYTTGTATGAGCENDSLNANWQYFGGSEAAVFSATGAGLVPASACLTVGGSLECGQTVGPVPGDLDGDGDNDPGQVI